ncbi:hypothetical protein BgiMline_002758 [Biomphalaria glabrata]|nr:hypothetical protein BgiMline_011351 [Biomphalaria glabrata]KAI8792782.1 hypothetical protein BgiBS90_005771 [Biomphalaria glabrata]
MNAAVSAMKEYLIGILAIFPRGGAGRLAVASAAVHDRMQTTSDCMRTAIADSVGHNLLTSPALLNLRLLSTAEIIT